MRVGIAIPVGFIGAHRVFIPLAGEHALAANRLKPMADAANPGEQIDKAERIVRMTGRRARQQVLQHAIFTVAEAMACPLAGDQSLEDRRAPVAVALGIQKMRQRSGIINFQQLAQ